MENKIVVTGKHLLEGMTEFHETVRLIETESEQYVLQVGCHVVFYYTSPDLAVDVGRCLDVNLDTLLWADWEMLDLVSTWLDFGAECVDLASKVDSYFEALAENVPFPVEEDYE